MMPGLALAIRHSNNNLAVSVFNKFALATAIYGMPDTLRVDEGVENADVALFKHSFGNIIRGRSVHNQCIERLWVDMWNGATNIFHSLFNEMEAMGILEPDNEVHIWVLHFVFLPRINRALEVFVQQ